LDLVEQVANRRTGNEKVIALHIRRPAGGAPGQR
jgi:hypothetical protein